MHQILNKNVNLCIFIFWKKSPFITQYFCLYYHRVQTCRSAFKLIFQLQLPLHLGVGDPFWKFIFFYWIWPKNDSSQNSIRNKIRNIHSKNIHSIVSRIFMRIIHSKKWGKLFKKSNISWFSFVLLNQEIWDAIYLGQLCV